MCLVVKKDQEMLVAEKDIVVYKVLEIKNLILYQTPYAEMPIWFPFRGRTIKPKQNKVCRYKSMCLNRMYYDDIEYGVLHCFRSVKDAHNLCGAIDYDYVVNEVAVFQMVIPKGTEYIPDWQNMCIGTKKLRFVKRLSINDIIKLIDEERRLASQYFIEPLYK